MSKIKVEVKKLPKSEVEIEGELEAPAFEEYFSKALQKIGERTEVKGFRKGKVPENVLLQNIPEIKILEEMAQMALSEHYPKILEVEKIDAISEPQISITKLARKNPLGFKIKVAVMPEIKLPDYRKIGKKITGERTETEKNIAVTDEDVESTILDIRKSRAHREHMAKHESKEEHEHKEELPEFNDEFVKALGPFQNVADFKEKLKENIEIEKVNQAREKTRLMIMEEIIEDSEIEVPSILTEMELNKILYKMESDITMMGLKFDDYLKQIKKTVEDLRKEFHKDAEKKAKFSLIFHKIAGEEKIVPEKDEVEKEVAMILEQYKDASPDRARMHVEQVLTNEKIFKLLES